ncbi:hypothetical protein GCM10027514_21170 [Azotobacter armeniacus]
MSILEQLAGSTRLDLSADLHELPDEIFALADSLEILNLSGNRLTSLPADEQPVRQQCLRQLQEQCMTAQVDRRSDFATLSACLAIR